MPPTAKRTRKAGRNKAATLRCHSQRRLFAALISIGKNARKVVFETMKRDEQRASGIAARNALSWEERERRSLAIVEQIVASPLWRDADIVLSYRAVGHEVDLSALEDYARAEGKRLCYPLCTAPGEMIALLPRDAQSWRKGSYGICEPIRELSEEIPPEALKLVLCPCTAYDSENHRMGMGGGYYDRYLPRCTNAHFVAVAFTVQECDRLDVQPWDVGMEAVVRS